MTGTSDRPADLAVIGGGVFGLMIAREAGLRGRRALLLEAGRVGGATSANWFRILHGGLRYLQSLDFKRTLESAQERRWFLQFAPDLVRPMPFLMPLYGRGKRGPMALRAAFALEAGLTFRRNRDVAEDLRLTAGRVLSPRETQACFADVRREGLSGGALWNEVVVPDSARLIARLREAAEAQGAEIREECRAEGLETAGGRVSRVMLAGGGSVAAPVVINAAGPWSAEIAALFGSPAPALFRPALAFNLLLDCPPLAATGLAVSPPGSGAVLFLYPLEGKTFAGTWHCPWTADHRDARVPEAEIDTFLDALAAAAPTLGATRGKILGVYPGLQPARNEASVEISHRDMIVNHGETGGPHGFFSLSGVKFTTARRVAAKVLDLAERSGAWN